LKPNVPRVLIGLFDGHVAPNFALRPRTIGAAGTVARPPTSWQRRRGLGNAKLTLRPCHRFPRTQIRLQVRR
jgi:hypothetical protein